MRSWKTTKRVQCPICSMDFSASTTFCACGTRQQTWPKNKRSRLNIRSNKVSNTSKLIRSSRYDLEIRAATSTDKAVHNSRTAKPRTVTQSPVQKVSQLETAQTETNTAQFRKDGTWTHSIAKVSVTKDEHGLVVMSGIILRPPRPRPIRNTNAQRQKE